MENTTPGNRPEKKIRAGAITATIWQNQGQSKNGEPVTYRTISLERNYKDKNDEWKSTNSFRLNDLPKVALVSQKAYEYLVISDSSGSGENTSADSEIAEEIVM
jgi:hypothetical protein